MDGTTTTIILAPVIELISDECAVTFDGNTLSSLMYCLLVRKLLISSATLEASRTVAGSCIPCADNTYAANGQANCLANTVCGDLQAGGNRAVGDADRTTAGTCKSCGILFLLEHSFFIVFSEITAFQRTQNSLTNFFTTCSLQYIIYVFLHLLPAKEKHRSPP